MPNLRFTFVATAGTVQHNAPDLTAGQETLFLNWLWAHYAPKDMVVESPTFGQPLPRNTANEAQAFRNYAAALWRGTRANVQSWKLELDRAAITTPAIPEE